ncbi:MAG: hypothetical protein Q7V53_07265 [Caldisericota bacterium]|nr:hypothetical protein [Caldisericota bacterium]
MVTTNIELGPVITKLLLIAVGGVTAATMWMVTTLYNLDKQASANTVQQAYVVEQQRQILNEVRGIATDQSIMREEMKDVQRRLGSVERKLGVGS